MNPETWPAEAGEYYEDTEHLSSTMIRCYVDSPLEFRDTYVTKKIKQGKPSRFMEIGSGAHVAAWEMPDLPAKVFNAGPRPNFTTKEGKAIREEKTADAAGRILLWESEFADAMGIRESILGHDFARSILENSEDDWNEAALRWIDDATGLRCKMKVDKMRFGWIADLKTASDISRDKFQRDIMKIGRHVQAAQYCEGHMDLFGFGRPKFYWILVHSSAPYEVAVYQAGVDVIDEGKAVRSRALKGIAKSRKTGDWAPEGYGGVELMELPSYAKKITQMDGTSDW